MITNASIFISNNISEKQEQIHQLRAKVLQAEQERMEGAKTLDISEAKKQLKERLNDT